MVKDNYHFRDKQEFSYPKQIARQLWAHNTSMASVGLITLEVLVRDHSRSLETEPLDKSYTTYY